MNELKKNFKLSVKEKYLDAVPELTSNELHALTESMILKGQLTPIECNESGIILDGHNRYHVCLQLKLKPKYNIRKFDSEEAEYQYVLEANLTRRHLNAFQRVELYYKTYKIEKEISRHLGRDSHRGRVTEIIGRRIGIGPASVTIAVWLIEHATELEKMKLRLGIKSINKIYGGYRNAEKKGLRKPKPVKNKVQCPECSHQMYRSELVKVGHG